MSRQECMSMEPLLHHDVVERIMEMFPVKSLLRFKAVSKQWQSTIESRYFQESQLNHRERSRDPDVLMVCIHSHDFEADTSIESLRTLVLGSLSSVKIPTSWENTFYSVCGNSCDGLVCLYHSDLCFVVNPATRWHRTLPRCHFQQNRSILGTYNVGFDGKLHWFTQCKETEVLSLDIHTETFEVISNVPFANVDPYNNNIVMCNFDNRLSVSQKMMSEQVIWLFSSGNKTLQENTNLTTTVLVAIWS
uniref:F-box domain-containing protein n=1 Tax=Brassica oleracea var. oleracea TaxID=109376 RepID=A0A0D3DPP0_BRAOL